MLVISIIIMTIYLVLLVWFSNSIYYNQDTSDEKYAPNVSVIVASRNEEKNLPFLLEALINQNYPINKYEIILTKRSDSATFLVN